MLGIDEIGNSSSTIFGPSRIRRDRLATNSLWWRRCGGARACEPGLCQRTLHDRKMRQIMRSELVYEAGLKIENRFLLAATVMRAVKKLHVSSTRTEDTVNRGFAEVAKGTPMLGELPEITPPPPIDILLIVPAA